MMSWAVIEHFNLHTHTGIHVLEEQICMKNKTINEFPPELINLIGDLTSASVYLSLGRTIKSIRDALELITTIS